MHLNEHGEWLMAECVKAYLRYDPKLGPSPAEAWVKAYEVGQDVNWADGKLRLEFEGKWLVKWPVIAPIGSEAPLAVEDWTLAVKREDAANDKLFSFTLTGSKTGADGEGRSDARFVSKSGRVVIETNAWNVAYALSLRGIKPVPEQFTVKWRVEPRFMDEFVSPGINPPSAEPIVTLANGLPNRRHTLEIAGSEATPIAALRVHRPPLPAPTTP
jgi:hypothetical protein